ncbi:NUDIX domain-containing protein [Liquorilactobacillus hordei]|uniref:NUDIX domain-containing protein n=1 Tax=Liquorilactobacillus hordei TaxID=468911 RepID=UPI001CBD3C29|nr:NUDIX domain-containing protein [Liquorilactobacillus hordei]MBZ2404941.1 NTP pyrophosphohydrolase [Liquorilactobacillus hordei]
MKVFGNKNIGVNYFVRKGAYAVIFRNQNRSEIGLIRTHEQQYFLPGGGIEKGETAEDALIREMLEETGYSIKNNYPFCHAQRYFVSTLPVKRPMLSDGYFFISQLDQRIQKPTEKNNYFEWINIKECEKLLFHVHQYYAVQQALKEEGADHEFK